MDTKNLLSAVILSIAVLVGWHYFYERPRLERAQQQALDAKAAAAQAKSAGDVSMAAPEETTLADRTSLIRSTERLRIDNGHLHGSINLIGARFDDITLAQYKESPKPGSKEVVLLSPSGSTGTYFGEFGWYAADKSTRVPDKNTRWASDVDTLNAGGTAQLSWNNGQGLLFLLKISLDENYMFSVTQEVRNSNNQPVNLYPYGILHRIYSSEEEKYLILHEGPLAVFDQVLHEVSYDDLKKEKKSAFEGVTGWLGITDKYWLSAIIPDRGESMNVKFSYSLRNENAHYQADYLGQKLEVPAGSSLVLNNHLFTGAKRLGLLDRYAKTLNIPLFDRAVDFGWLYFITKPIFKALTSFHTLLGNFGLAILMLTVVVKLLMFPLANKSYVSMHHMKRLQPEMQALKERYGNDKMHLQKEMMGLYQREKVNPMAGCLPLLVQIPVFFALYKVLFVTIEMRHAPFFGWVHDLSAPDPTNIFTLFGLIAWNPPHLLHIGIWPLVMGATMVLQQRLNPQPTDPVQAKVMRMLPYMFVFLFGRFPAGLVIYWAWNNSLSILQQWVITRKLGTRRSAASQGA